MLCRLSYCPAFGDREVSFASSRIRENSGHRAMHPNSHESRYPKVTRIGHEKSPVFVTPGFERDSEHDRESQAQVLIGKRIDGSGAILFLFSNLSFETRS